MDFVFAILQQLKIIYFFIFSVQYSPIDCSNGRSGVGDRCCLLIKPICDWIFAPEEFKTLFLRAFWSLPIAAMVLHACLLVHVILMAYLGLPVAPVWFQWQPLFVVQFFLLLGKANKGFFFSKKYFQHAIRPTDTNGTWYEHDVSPNR